MKSLPVFVDTEVKIINNIRNELGYSGRSVRAPHRPFQQDLECAHKAKIMQERTHTELAEFTKTNSVGLNQLDFSVWSVIEVKACSSRYSNSSIVLRSPEPTTLDWV